MRVVYTLLLALAASWLPAQGYRISVQIDGFKRDSLFLGYYLGDKQYLRDTATAGADGRFVFSDKEALPGGMYLIVLPPDNNFFQILINPEEQQFSIQTDVNDLAGKIKVNGSKDNQLFYQYLHFLDEKRPLADEINKSLKEAGTDEARRKPLQDRLDKLNEEVTAYQKKIVSENQKSLTAAIIRANWNVDMPAFTGTEEEVQIRQWRHMQKHVFDNLDLADPRMLRTPFLFERIDYYVHKLQVQHPDTISTAIDVVLEKMRKNEECFRFYLVHFLNEAARSNLVGMDAVYVHLVDKYYRTGQATWTDGESMKKILQNATELKPLLIGKVAPNFAALRRDGTKTSLYEIDSEYTILYFWRYDCGHCKESTPHMKSFYEKFKDKGVKIVAVCVKDSKEVSDCWKYVDENGTTEWLHLYDPYLRYSTIYSIKTTPQIYILDRKKEILSKRIGAEQLEEVMDKIIEMKQQEKEKGK